MGTLPVLNHPTYRMTIPSTKQEVEFRSFLVSEEKVLMLSMEGDNKEIITAVKKIIDVCTFNKLDMDKLAIFDIEYAFLQLRSKSKGEQIKAKHNCEKCNHENDIMINIDDINVNFQDGHDRKIELEKNIGVVMKYPDINIAEDINENEKNIETIFSVIVNCIDYIYDAENVYKQEDVGYDEIDNFISSMNDKQFAKIQKFFDTMPALEIKIPYNCKGKKCKNKEPIVLRGLQSFLQ